MRVEDPEREKRIGSEAIVDAYGPEEQALGWYYYLEDRLNFPFAAKCRRKRIISPLKVGERVQVIGMAPEEECEREMFVEIRWGKKKLVVPLSELSPVEADEETRQSVEDWHYWIERGYRF
jgi:hypothetical protein